MSHFAKVVDGIVETVIVAEQDFIDGLEGAWVQTSYNTYGGVHYSQREEEAYRYTPEGESDEVIVMHTVDYDDGGIALRKNYASIGDIYDAGRDAFYESQPYSSWTLNEDTCVWEAPTAYPDDGKQYTWDEDTTSWVED
mgnify:FL=1|tara:strand:- start:1049 stop:1465 length:417 start_codon:yes stop_codon:yes gene_type:complete